jgi:hypothetical protein
MRLRILAMVFGVAAALTFSGGARALPCDVFTDVQDTDSYCPAVVWLKNRQVTLGCASTLYCPADFVSRAAMALFMQRLGTALTPQFYGRALANTPPTANLAVGQFQPFCTMSAPVAAAGYTRIARARGHLSLQASGSTRLQMFLVYSVDGAPFVNANSVGLSVPNPSGNHELTWASNQIPLAVGSTYAFAIGISNPPGSTGPLALATNECMLEVDVINQN